VLGISRWASHWARFGADRPALLFEGRDRSWGQLEEGCARLAAGLLAVGVRKGDRVGGLMQNAPEHFEVVLACARIGAIFVPLNPLLTTRELAELAGDAELSAVVTDDSFVGVLAPLEEQVGAERIFFVGTPPEQGRALEELHRHGALRDDLDVQPSDPLMICYTSGTTGRSRGAVLTHANMDGVATSAACVDALSHHDRAIVPVPLAFTGAGVSFAIPLLRAGGSIVIRRGLVPEQLLADIEQEGVTFIGVVPLVLERMAADPSFEERDLTGLRVAKSGGAPVPEHLIRLYQSRGVGLVNAYGLTEGSGLNLELPAHESIRRLGSVGIPLLGQEARVVDAAGRQVGPGEPGELVLSGTCVMEEYWRDPESTAATLRDGWLHTGDLATVDEDGYFRIVDRAKDMIISGGINIYPAEIETVLAAHPDIVEVAVVGVPDPEWGETPVACVVTTNPGLTLADLDEFTKDSLAKFKRPRRLELRQQGLPRGMSGKILKREIRKELAGPSV
jgi:fatty-acyl-CoA synthase